MRIVLVSQEYPPETAHGGIGTQTHAKAHGLAALGHQVTVLSHSVTGRREVSTRDGVEVVRIPGPDERFTIGSEALRWMAYSLEVAAALERLEAEAPRDLIDFPEWAGEGFAYQLNRAESSRPRVVVQLHGPAAMLASTIGWPEVGSDLHRVATLMEGTSVRLADAVISSGGASADACSTAYGMARERVPLWHSGVDVRRFSPDPGARRPGLILFVGKIAENKGVFRLLEAVLRLRNRLRGLRLRLIGRGNAQALARLRREIAAADADDLVEVAGYVAHADLPRELCAADVMAAPSACEGGPGFVYLEAMACGVPVVGCLGSGATEVIQDGTNGLLVPPHSAHAVTTALFRVLSDPELRERLRGGAREYAVREADGSKRIQWLEGFYERVLEAGATVEVPG